MNTNHIINQINEAIASPKTSEENRQLLLEIRVQLEKSNSIEEFIPLIVKLIELMGVFSSFWIK